MRQLIFFLVIFCMKSLLVLQKFLDTNLDLVLDYMIFRYQIDSLNISKIKIKTKNFEQLLCNKQCSIGRQLSIIKIWDWGHGSVVQSVLEVVGLILSTGKILLIFLWWYIPIIPTCGIWRRIFSSMTTRIIQSSSISLVTKKTNKTVVHGLQPLCPLSYLTGPHF